MDSSIASPIRIQCSTGRAVFVHGKIQIKMNKTIMGNIQNYNFNSRRDFLKKSALLALSSGLFGSDNDLSCGDESMLHVIRKGIEYKIPFMRNGTIYRDGYHDLCRVFGDTHDLVAIEIDPELFLTLEYAQNWLIKHNIHKPIILTSGYRTEHTNNITEGAAKNSMHLYGKAADVRIDGISIKYLARLLRASGGGGIGMYSNFVHVDTWKERVWRG